MTFEFTQFRHIRDKKTDNRREYSSWRSFVNCLSQMYRETRVKPPKDVAPWEVPDAAPLISPAIYKEKEGRGNANVAYWGGWAALDVDDYEGSAKDAFAKLAKLPYAMVIYNTSSSTKEKPKWRIVVPLDRHVPHDEIKDFWYALNTEFESLGDKQTKDLSRMYYVPGVYPGAYSFLRRKRGNPINVDKLLEKHPRPKKDLPLRSRLSSEVQEKLREYKKRTLSTDYSWTTYRDCPFVNKRLIAEYAAITESGWYSKLYSIMVSTALFALKKGYDISVLELETIARQIDADHGSWYTNRPLDIEAKRALEYAHNTF